MIKLTKRHISIGILLATIVTGCQPSAPPAIAPPASIPHNPAPEVAKNDEPVKKEEPANKLRIPKIESESPPVESPDAPPAPTPTAPTPTTPPPASKPIPPTPPETPSPNNLAPIALAKGLAPRISPEGPPTVVMSDGHRQLCLVKVGDSFPALTLADIAEKKVSLPTLYGEKLTIVVFWNNRHILAREQFDRMQREIAARYGVAGVSIVAVNVGDSPAMVQKILADSPQVIPCLLDPDQEAFKKIAVSKLPRTYVLDKKGKILWFDIEYSRDMLRGLDNAVHVFLGGST